MSEESFLHLFRSRWHEIASQFWPQTPRERAKAELERLDAELARRQSRVLIFLKRIEKLRNILEQREQRLGLFAALMQKMPKSTGVLAEWEHRQQTVNHLRERLQELEEVYARRLSRLRRWKQKRTELRVRLLAGSFPKPVDEENDLDYPF
jgi:chromosome segregation ATPase